MIMNSTHAQMRHPAGPAPGPRPPAPIERHGSLKLCQFSESIFAARFNITRGDLEAYLADALSRGGDYADLYFEYLLTSSIGLDESMVKSATQGSPWASGCG